jgi:uncharacterized protein
MSLPAFIHNTSGGALTDENPAIRSCLRQAWGCGIIITMDLPKSILARFQDVFKNYPEILAVYLFGSRATSTARPDSDYDLAVVSVLERPARCRKMDILSDLAKAGFDNVDLSFLDRDNLVLSHEAVRMNQIVFCRPEFDRGSFYSQVIRMYFDIQPCLNVQREAFKERILHGAA